MTFKHTADDGDEVVDILTNFMFNSYELKKLNQVVSSTSIKVNYNKLTKKYDIEADIIITDNNND